MYNIIVLIFLCRSGKYTLNTSTGSDGDLLLNSPGRDTDVSKKENNDPTSHSTPSKSHDPIATPSSNGLETGTTLLSSGSSPEEQRKVLNSNENNCTKNTDSHAANSSSSGCNSEAGSGEGKVNCKESLPDGKMGSEKELQDNFK